MLPDAPLPPPRAPRVPLPRARAGPPPDGLRLLGSVRDAIDVLDARVADLLAQRARLSRKAALAKALARVEHRNVAREATVRHHYKEVLCRSGWTEAQVDGLADALFDVAGEAPDVRVALQGGVGSWSEESLLHLLPSARPVRCETVADAWRRVREGHAVAAWLPRANRLVGDIPETRGAHAEGEAWTESTYPVRHALLALPGLRLEDVERVEGHPHALAQCARSLDALVPRAARVGTVDGAHSAWRLRASTRAAVVASARLAARAGLAVLAPSVADDPGNATRFSLLVPRRTWNAP